MLIEILNLNKLSLNFKFQGFESFLFAQLIYLYLTHLCIDVLIFQDLSFNLTICIMKLRNPLVNSKFGFQIDNVL